MLTEIVLDIETIGTKQGVTVLSIGAVFLEEGRTGVSDAQFYNRISRNSCKIAGLVEDKDTLDWWAKQPIDVREEAFGGTTPLNIVLDNLAGFIREHSTIRDVKVWGNGAGFDAPILEACYDAVDMPVPWKFWNTRCFRTLKAENPGVPYIQPANAHHALDDAIAEASHMVRIRAQKVGS